MCSKLDIPIYFSPIDLDYLQTAHRLAYLLKKHHVDIAIFHEVDPINHMVARLAEVPCSLVYYHGLLPQAPAFDGILLHRPEEIIWQQKLLDSIECTPLAVPLEVNVTKLWKEKATPRSSFPCPDDALLLTTLTGHLETRISWPMRNAIIKILKQVPNAYYLPMGTPPTTTKSELFPTSQDVLNRIIFLGENQPAAHMLRSMDLYLNDFPVGGGIAVIEAMAASLPIVAMFDKTGLPPSRNVGHFLGREYCIESNAWEDYADDAIALLQDKKARKKRGKHSFSRYLTMNDPARHAERFQESVLHFFHDIQSKEGQPLVDDPCCQLT